MLDIRSAVTDPPGISSASLWRQAQPVQGPDRAMRMSLTRRSFASLTASLAAGLVTVAPDAAAAIAVSDPKADRAALAARQKLINGNIAARKLHAAAVAELVFPRIVKAGFLLGGAFGEGVLLQGNKAIGYYNSAAASYGLQAGVQWFGYALFFMNAGALKYLYDSRGLEVGVGPSVVVVDQGVAKKLSSTTVTQDVYAFIFGQNGLMAGIGIEGSKITKI